MLRAVELLDCARPQVLVELICRLQVHDVHSKNVFARGCAIKPNAIVLGIQIEVRIWLECDAKCRQHILPLIRIGRIVVCRVCLLEVSG